MAQPPNVAEALLRYGGMYGSVWRDNVMLAEAVDLTAAAEVNRIEVPIVGATRNGHKPGRETREGTLRIQKVDAKWEMEVYSFMSAGIEERRRLRDDPAETRPSRTFNLHIKHDDPDALGLEEWVLEDCQLWRLPLGISITDDITEREFPLTWERERPLHAFRAQRNGDTVVPLWLTPAYAASGQAPPRDF